MKVTKFVIALLQQGTQEKKEISRQRPQRPFIDALNICITTPTNYIITRDLQVTHASLSVDAHTVC
jgi:hypothetical protein